VCRQLKKVLLEPVFRRKLIKETKKGLEKVAREKESHEKVFPETRQIIVKEFDRQIFFDITKYAEN
jgi:hypothetical protein